MALAPLNFVHSMQLVPVFKWEPVEVPDTTAAAPPPAMAYIDGAAPPAPTPSASTTDLRLVFKGFQWRPVADCVHFPRPNWESCFAGTAGEASETQECDRRAQLEATRRVKPIAQPAQMPDAAQPSTDLSAHETDPTERT
jgi:hypothetical protein